MKWIFILLMLFSISNLLFGQQNYIKNNSNLGNNFTPNWINIKSCSLYKSVIKYHYLHYFSSLKKRVGVYNNMPISVSNINIKYFKSAKPNSVALYDFTLNNYPPATARLHLVVCITGSL